MTLQHSLETVYFIWQRINSTTLAYRGQVIARTAGEASTVARERWGQGQFQVREQKFSRIALAYA